MLKGVAACNVPDVRETPRAIIAVRGLLLPSGLADTIHNIPPSRPCTKFWLAVRAKQAVLIPSNLGNDRSSCYRRRPSEFASCLSQELLVKIKQEILVAIDTAEQGIGASRAPNAKRQKLEATYELTCMRKLVGHMGVRLPIPVERRSIAWKASGYTVYAPGDILDRECSCARLESFPVHMSVDCRDLGPFNVARKTWFNREEEVIPAFLHAEKCRLLCQLRAQSVRHEDILRLKVFDDDRDHATVVCGMESYIEMNAGWRATNDNFTRTSTACSG